MCLSFSVVRALVCVNFNLDKRRVCFNLNTIYFYCVSWVCLTKIYLQIIIVAQIIKRKSSSSKSNYEFVNITVTHNSHNCRIVGMYVTSLISAPFLS